MSRLRTELGNPRIIVTRSSYCRPYYDAVINDEQPPADVPDTGPWAWSAINLDNYMVGSHYRGVAGPAMAIRMLREMWVLYKHQGWDSWGPAPADLQAQWRGRRLFTGSYAREAIVEGLVVPVLVRAVCTVTDLPAPRHGRHTFKG